MDTDEIDQYSVILAFTGLVIGEIGIYGALELKHLGVVCPKFHTRVHGRMCMPVDA
jgi:hypothetical protein